MDKENVTYTHTQTVQYYLATKKNEIMSFVVTWMDSTFFSLKYISPGYVFSSWKLYFTQDILQHIVDSWAVAGIY